METKKTDCSCSNGETIVLACSGASDVGQISDLAARKLRDTGFCKMSCLALVGAGIENSIESFRNSKLILIDGCSVDCGKKILERNGINNYDYIRLTDIGFTKGQSPANTENIGIAYSKIIGIQ